MTRIPPLAKVVCGAVIISFSAVLVLAVSVGPTASAFYRVLVSAAVLFLWPSRSDRADAAPAGRASLSPHETRHAGAAAPAGLSRLTVLAGAVFALDLFCWHRSVLYTGAGLATILGNTQVFYVSLLGILVYRERATSRFLISVPLAFFGIMLLVRFKSPEAADGRFLAGVFYGLATGVCYAAFLYAMRRIQNADSYSSPARRLSAVLAVSAFALGGIGWLEGSLSLPRGTDPAWLLLLGAGPGALAWLVISKNLPRVPISRAGLALLLQPVLASLWGAAFYGESWRPLQAVGGATTLLAIYLGTVKSAPSRREPPLSS